MGRGEEKRIEASPLENCLISSNWIWHGILTEDDHLAIWPLFVLVHCNSIGSYDTPIAAILMYIYDCVCVCALEMFPAAFAAAAALLLVGQNRVNFNYCPAPGFNFCCKFSAAPAAAHSVACLCSALPLACLTFCLRRKFTWGKREKRCLCVCFLNGSKKINSLKTFRVMQQIFCITFVMLTA